jgi:hypothetical protein
MVPAANMPTRRCQIAARMTAFEQIFTQSAAIYERTRKPSLAVNGEVFLTWL